MARHWKPPGKIVRIRPVGGKRLRSLDEFVTPVRTSWHGANQPPPRLPGYLRFSGGGRVPPGAKAGLLLIAAACVGVAIGAYQALGPRQIVADEALPQRVETIVPEVADDPADAEWAARAQGQDRAPAGADVVPAGSARTVGAEAVRASFSYCKWGGGRNCVVDGDTFYVGGAKVRIAGIDAPETHPPRCANEARLGEQATAQLRALLNSGAVTMTGIDRDRDSYGRLLRNVHVNGQDVGATLISAGVARAYAGGRRSWC